MPTHTRSEAELRGYFRLNRDRTIRAARAKGLESPTQIARALGGVMSESSFFRIWYDTAKPTSRLVFALTTLLDAKVEELFDPIPLENRVTRAPASN